MDEGARWFCRVLTQSEGAPGLSASRLHAVLCGILENDMKVKIRVAVAMNDIGTWTAIGNGGGEDPYDGEQDMMDAVHNIVEGIPVAWIEAEVEYPEPKTVSGNVTSA